MVKLQRGETMVVAAQNASAASLLDNDRFHAPPSLRDGMRPALLAVKAPAGSDDCELGLAMVRTVSDEGARAIRERGFNLSP